MTLQQIYSRNKIKNPAKKFFSCNLNGVRSRNKLKGRKKERNFAIFDFLPFFALLTSR